VAQYQFDQSLHDYSPNQSDAAFCGKLTYQAALMKSGTHSLTFNGTDNYLLLPPGVATSRQITIATWVRWGSGSNWQRIFDFGSGTDRYMFLTPSNGSEMRLVLKNGGDEQILSAGKRMTSALWNHVAVTMSDDAVRLYINGEEIASSTDITLRPSDILPACCFVGRSQFASDPLFKGYIDDFRIYNYALSKEEIAAVMEDLVNNVEGVASEVSPVVSTEYYSTDGVRLLAPTRGITIMRQRHADGTVKTKKMIR